MDVIRMFEVVPSIRLRKILLTELESGQQSVYLQPDLLCLNLFAPVDNSRMLDVRVWKVLWGVGPFLIDLFQCAFSQFVNILQVLVCFHGFSTARFFCVRVCMHACACMRVCVCVCVCVCVYCFMQSLPDSQGREFRHVKLFLISFVCICRELSVHLHLSAYVHLHMSARNESLSFYLLI